MFNTYPFKYQNIPFTKRPGNQSTDKIAREKGQKISSTWPIINPLEHASTPLPAAIQYTSLEPQLCAVNQAIPSQRPQYGYNPSDFLPVAGGLEGRSAASLRRIALTESQSLQRYSLQRLPQPELKLACSDVRKFGGWFDPRTVRRAFGISYFRCRSPSHMCLDGP